MPKAKFVSRVALGLLLGLFVLLVPTTHHFIPAVQASTVTIRLAGNLSGWNNTNPGPTITITQGDTVSITLMSTDYTHQFALDADKDNPMFIGMCPSGDTCSSTFSPGYPGSISLSSSFTSGLTPGTYKYFCTFHTTMVGDFIVKAPPPDYSLSANPTSLTIPQGSSGNSTITVTGVNGFTGTITLSTSFAPTGPTYSFNPVTVPISSPSGTSILTIRTTASTPSGMYTATITGNNGTVTRTTTVSLTVTVPDFAISASPGSLSIQQNSTSASTIILSSLNGFSGNLNLTAKVSPAGPTLSFSRTTVTLAAGGTIQSVLTISAIGGPNNPVSTGTYSVNVTVTNGRLSHWKTIQATVNPPITPAPPLPLTVLAGAGVIVVAAVAATVFFVRRRTK